MYVFVYLSICLFILPHVAREDLTYLLLLTTLFVGVTTCKTTKIAEAITIFYLYISKPQLVVAILCEIQSNNTIFSY